MSRRISLTRIIAINWYGFRQIFDVDESVLISGAFGTGKSALLDEVRAALRAYDDTRRRLEKQEDEAGFLR
jgi:predicted ATP-binding protein involved in virulence